MDGSDRDQTSDVVGVAIHLLFSYRGSIGRLKYWIGLFVALATAIFALMSAAQVMNPTAPSSGAILAVPLLAIFVWIHSAVTIKRLRDAGLSGAVYILFVAGPLVWLAITAEYIESMWPLIVCVLIALLAAPGILPKRVQSP
jgi:uncharacterized membrane protein YhaH (DUF805 family)